VVLVTPDIGSKLVDLYETIEEGHLAGLGLSVRCVELYILVHQA
jgi:hypothetical protein